jgi:hypothetical protein
MLTNQLLSFHLIKGLYRLGTEGRKIPSFQSLLLRIPLTTDQNVRGSTPLGRTTISNLVFISIFLLLTNRALD